MNKLEHDSRERRRNPEIREELARLTIREDEEACLRIQSALCKEDPTLFCPDADDDDDDAG